MQTLKPLFLLLVILLVASLACSTSAPPVVEPTLSGDQISTIVAQTLIAMQPEATLTPSATPVPPTATPTFTPDTPTASPTVTLTFTPLPTNTPAVPLISVYVPTNCRVGPGKVYALVGALLVGETTEVYGRDPTGSYWYVRNPDTGPQFCWLWGEYATVSGNVLVLPVYTPPPTPTPAPGFKASYSGLQNCLTEWWVDIELENTGSLVFRSISLTVQDTVTKTTLSYVEDEFASDTGCSSSSSKNTLPTGGKVTVSSARFTANPAGHKMKATITLCSAVGVNGQCLTQEITFTP